MDAGIDSPGSGSQARRPSYRTYKVHRETVLDLLDEEGEEVRLALFGSILEREGEFKLFSYVVD